KYMDSLLLDLLAYSRLARVEMEPLVINLEEPIQEVLSIVEKEVRDRQACIEVSSPLATAYAHLPTLKQIVSNLISNSMKFTAPERPPVIRIYTTREANLVR